jgi:hypothetical protein
MGWMVGGYNTFVHQPSRRFILLPNWVVSLYFCQQLNATKHFGVCYTTSIILHTMSSSSYTIVQTIIVIRKVLNVQCCRLYVCWFSCFCHLNSITWFSHVGIFGFTFIRLLLPWMICFKMAAGVRMIPPCYCSVARWTLDAILLHCNIWLVVICMLCCDTVVSVSMQVPASCIFLYGQYGQTLSHMTVCHLWKSCQIGCASFGWENCNRLYFFPFWDIWSSFEHLRCHFSNSWFWAYFSLG